MAEARNPLGPAPKLAAQRPPQGTNAVRRRKPAYEKPSLERARRFMLRMHPSYTPTGQEKDRQLWPCCVPTGRFCWASLQGCDPCCEGRISRFIEYGSGVTAWFKNLKLLAWTFVLMTFLAVPALVFNVNGKGALTSISSLSLTATTIGNLGVTNSSLTGGQAYLDIVIPGLTGPFGVPQRTAALVYSLCDLGMCLVFLAAYLWVRSLEGREDRQVNKATITADDFTVFMPWIPHDTTELDVRAYFTQLTADAAAEAEKYGFAGLFDIAEIHLVEDSAAAVGTFIARGRVFRQMERLDERVRRLNYHLHRAQTADPGSNGGCVVSGCGCRSLAAQIDRLRARKDRLRGKAESLTVKAQMRVSDSVVAAFVTFERSEAKDWLMEQVFAGQNCAAWACQERHLRFKGHRVRVLEAPAPSSILWHNLGVTAPQQIMRQVFTGLLTLVLLAGSFALLWFASYQQAKFSGLAVQLANCNEPSIVAGLASGSINATSVAGLPVGTPSLYCYCATLNFGSATLQQLQSSTFAPNCPYQVCPAWLELSTTSVWNQPYCVEWLKDRSIAIGITVAASILLIIVNGCLAVLMRFLTQLEGHHSFEELNASLALRLWGALFINTGLLVVLINVSWPLQLPEQFTTGKFSDFVPKWYTDVGNVLMLTQILGLLTNHVYELSMACWYRCVTGSSSLTAPSQRDLNERLLGPYNDYALRYAQVTNVLFVCFSFSAGMPLMVPVAAASFLIYYWVEKWLFVSYYRRPPAFNTRMQRTMSSLYPIALLLHLGIGMWQLSAAPVVGNLVADGIAEAQGYANLISPAVGSAIQRVTNLVGLPLFCLFVLVVLFLLLIIMWFLFRRCFYNTWNILTCNTCPNAVAWCGDGRQAHDWQSGLPSYTEALDPANKDTPSGLKGLPSYNILLSPEILAAFAIPLEFARRHKRLSDVARYQAGASSRNLGAGGFDAPAAAGGDGDAATGAARRPVMAPARAPQRTGGVMVPGLDRSGTLPTMAGGVPIDYPDYSGSMYNGAFAGGVGVGGDSVIYYGAGALAGASAYGTSSYASPGSAASGSLYSAGPGMGFHGPNGTFYHAPSGSMMVGPNGTFYHGTTGSLYSSPGGRGAAISLGGSYVGVETPAGGLTSSSAGGGFVRPSLTASQMGEGVVPLDEADEELEDEEDAGDLPDDGFMSGVPPAYGVSMRRLAVASDANRIARLMGTDAGAAADVPEDPGVELPPAPVPYEVAAAARLARGGSLRALDAVPPRPPPLPESGLDVGAAAPPPPPPDVVVADAEGGSARGLGAALPPSSASPRDSGSATPSGSGRAGRSGGGEPHTPLSDGSPAALVLAMAAAPPPPPDEGTSGNAQPTGTSV